MKGTNSYIVSSKRSGTYVLATEASDLCIYTSSYLTEFERRVFIDNLSIRSVEFSAGENAQIFCRCLMHDASKPNDSHMLPYGVPAGSETILCMHGFDRLTTSWVWIKFAATLFRQGFNVIMMDSPGFGKSSIAREVRCPLTAWKDWDAQLVTSFLAKLSVPRVNVVACYEGASTFASLLVSCPQVLAKNHYLHNPIFDCDQVSESNSLAVIKALLTTGKKRRIFATFDRTKYPDHRNCMQAALSDERIQALVVAERFMRQVSKAVGFNPITISPLASSDLSEVLLYSAGSQPGTASVFCLYPSKTFRIYVTQFLAGVILGPYSTYVSSLEMKSDAKPAQTVTTTTVVDPGECSLPRRLSYGVRIREMEDLIVTEQARKASEMEFLAQRGEDELLHQQALSESLRSASQQRITLAQVSLPKDSSQASKYLGRLVLQQHEIENSSMVSQSGRTGLPAFPENNHDIPYFVELVSI